MRYKIIINGYGAHIHVRRVSKEIHDFWSNYNSVAVCSHLFEDSYSDINGNPITSDKDPLFLGMAKSKRDRMLEVCGPRPSHIHVHVFDDLYFRYPEAANVPIANIDANNTGRKLLTL